MSKDSNLGETFSDNPQAVQRDCENVSSGALGLFGTLFEETKTQYLPRLSISPGEDLDVVARLRAEAESLGQQHTLMELELEALRRAIMSKEVELEEAKELQCQQLENSTFPGNRPLAKNDRETSLPINVIMHIFRLMRIFGSTSRDLSRTPLFRIARGFSDLPRWHKAIIQLIPVVLIHTSSLYNDAYMRMSSKQSAHLTRNPRLFELGNEDQLASINTDEYVNIVLKDTHEDLEPHLERAKQFQWNCLIILAASAESACDTLMNCGERIWRLRTLEVNIERERNNYGIYIRQTDRDDWSRSRIKIPPMPSDLFERALRQTALPIGAIPCFAPLMSRLEVASITVPGSISDMGTVLRGLQGLPPSLLSLSVKHERDTSRDVRIEGIDVVASFPNLIDLSLQTFEARGMNALLNGFNCPSLRVLSAHPSCPIKCGGMSGVDIATATEEAEIQVQFAEIVHKRFPRLTNLSYECTDFSSRPFLERMMKRHDKGIIPDLAPMPVYLLPCLRRLHVKFPDVDDVSLLISFATSRRRESKVSNILSIPVAHRTRILQEVGHGRGSHEFWHDCHIDALHLLVPDS